MSRKSFAGGTIILMLAGFIVKIFGFIYRIYLSNLIGAEGMGIIQLISPVYSLIILTLTSGISIAVSKMTAEEYARGNHSNLKKLTMISLTIVVTTGVIVSAFIYFYIDFITLSILKDVRTYLSLLVLIPCIPIVAAASAIKGYFYGMQDVVPTAVSQVVEQAVKITFIMALSLQFLDKGLAYACAVATFGTAIGEVANLLVISLVYISRRYKDKDRVMTSKGDRKRRLTRRILRIAIPISLNRFITSIMSAIELIMIPGRLLASGLGYTQALELYGKLSGMAMPLIYFPAFVTSSLATTLVPAISEALSLKRLRTVNHRISKSIKVTFVLGFIFTTLFITFPNEISGLFYKKEKVGDMLYMLSGCCVFFYLGQTLLGILNGLGKQGVSLRNSVVGYVIRISFVYFAIPVYGLKGYVVGMLVSMAIVCAMNLYTVKKVTGMDIDFENWIFKPGAVSIGMFFTGKYVLNFFEIFNLGKQVTIVLSVAGNIAMSIILMIVFGVLYKEDILKVLGGKKFFNVGK